jgi:ribonuclease-3
MERVEGEAHAHTFWVRCEVAALARRAQGSGSTRRSAEQEAAERVLGELEAPLDVAPG